MRFNVFVVALCFVTGCNSAKELRPSSGDGQPAATTAGQASDPNELPTLDSVHAALREHQSKFQGMRFAYKAIRSVGTYEELDKAGRILKEPSETAVSTFETEDSLRLLSAEDKDDYRIWRQWKQKGSDEELTRFAVYDGKLSTFVRQLPWPNGKRRWNEGHIMPHDDTDEFNDNIFDSFLHLNVCGMPMLTPGDVTHPFRWETNPYKWEITESTSRTFGIPVLRLEGNLDGSPYRFLVEVTRPPSSLVLSSVTQEKDSGNSIESYLVTKIDELEGVKYPAAGRYTRHASGASRFVDYQFSVSSAGKLGPTARSNWMPDFPSGTAVQNHITGEVEAIPHDKEDQSSN